MNFKEYLLELLSKTRIPLNNKTTWPESSVWKLIDSKIFPKKMVTYTYQPKTLYPYYLYVSIDDKNSLEWVLKVDDSEVGWQLEITDGKVKQNKVQYDLNNVFEKMFKFAEKKVKMDTKYRR